MDPAAAPPYGERLRRVDAEAVQPRIVTIGAQLRAREPAGGKLGAAVRQVLAAEDAETQHLLRRELGTEFGREVAADRLAADVDVALLHAIVHDDADPAGHLSNVL